MGMKKERSSSQSILAELFSEMGGNQPDTSYFWEIGWLIASDKVSKDNLEQVLSSFDLSKVRADKESGLSLTIEYVQACIKDGIIIESEILNAEILKRLFRIKEGDFYRNRFQDVKGLIEQEVLKLLGANENCLTEEHAEQLLGYQHVFDLSQDQFLKMTRDVALKAIADGAKAASLRPIY